MTPDQRAAALRLADDRPMSLDDDLYQWALDAEKMLRDLAAEPVAEITGDSQCMNDAYYKIDRFLRNNLADDDYAEYSAALDALYLHSPQDTALREAAQDVVKLVDYMLRYGEWYCAEERIERLRAALGGDHE